MLTISSLDQDTAILKFPLPERDQNDEPQAKRQKSEESTTAAATATTIEDKVKQDGYSTLEEFMADITLAGKAQLAKLASTESSGEPVASDEKATKVTTLMGKAYELFRRELAYPQLDGYQPDKPKPMDDDDSQKLGCLMIQADTNTGRRPLLSSLPQRPNVESEGKERTPKITGDIDLPPGFQLLRPAPGISANDMPGRSRVFGQTFPSPGNLAPLQPHKPAKSAIKNNVLTFYHPELTNQSRFRSGTYFSQNLSMGQWLDYSNATPSSHIKTKQRQRAQSLAGHKPSSTELEMSEMEALFRGAFSTFAPCKDDTAAMISSGQLSHMYWQQWGRRDLQRMIESYDPSDETAEDAAGPVMEIDEEFIQEVADNWDDSAIDPSLSQVFGQKSTEDKEVDDLLEEVSDLIETLASYQRNRNLTLPTSQDRHSTDPPNGDMLRNGSLCHQPTEEETMTYEALKSQLSLIIQTLPPFAVARIDSDKLQDLNVSTKIEVRAIEYKGMMEEDEPAARARQAAAQASNSGQRSHRTPSVSAGTPYANHQYGAQYGGRSPMPNTPHYPQTPVRPQPNMYQRSASAVQMAQPHQAQGRQSPQAYRTPSSYGGLAPQLAKSQTPYGHSNMPQYAGGVPNPGRMHPHQQGYPNMGQGTPNQRFPPGFQGGYPPQPQQQQQQQTPQPMHPQQPVPRTQFPPYLNGQMPQRTATPQMQGQSHGYNQSPTPSHQQHHQQQQQMSRPPYGTPGQAMPAHARQYSAGSPGMMPQPVPQQQAAAQQQSATRAVGITGYHTFMGDAEQQQLVEQARQQAQARQDAQARTIGYGTKVPPGEIAGLAGIGLTGMGNVDLQKLAAHRANKTAMGNNNNSMSPSPKPSVQPVRSPMSGGANGAVAPPPAASPFSMQGSSASPAPVGGFNPPS